ncbi:MAG: 4-hydroxy-tetrahydrodipicolinate synthase [Verrucomicrobiota bacterium]
MFQGTHTAIVTPFRDGDFDEAAFRSLVDTQLENGIKGIVPVGTTGESPTVSHDEHRRIIEVTVEQTAKRALVIAGTGSNSTREAIALTQDAEQAGADACLLVAPYYNKPSQEGLFEHFKAIAEATSRPIVLYSIPGRCVIEIGVETTARLAEACPNIVAIKEAGGSVERVNELVQALPDTFQILSGDDSMTLPFMAAGGVGVISVASNIIPAEMAALTQAVLDGNITEAQTIHKKYYRLFHTLLKLDTNPVPIKAALGLMGRIDPSLRRPMAPLSESATAELRHVLRELNIIAS